MNIGKSIKIACVKKEVTQDELSRLTGISKVTISHIINGRAKCRQDTLEKLVLAFDMSASEFIALGE